MKLRVLITSLLLGGLAHAQPLHIETQSGEVQLDVDLATDTESRMYGLMFRKKLGDHQGMLFIYPSPLPISLWMKNTYIPLDMIFIDDHGKIIHIHPNAEPRSLKTITSPKPAKAALEIKGGQAEKLGLREGDLVKYNFATTQ